MLLSHVLARSCCWDGSFFVSFFFLKGRPALTSPFRCCRAERASTSLPRRHRTKNGLFFLLTRFQGTIPHRKATLGCSAEETVSAHLHPQLPTGPLEVVPSTYLPTFRETQEMLDENSALQARRERLGPATPGSFFLF